MSVAFTAGSTSPTMTASMTAQVRHLQTLITSFHPLIAIETVEEERVQTLLQGATAEMNLPMMEWSIAHGLIRSSVSSGNCWQQDCAPGTNRISYDGTQDPSAVLTQIKDLNLKVIFWLKDFAAHLDDPTIARQFREFVFVIATANDLSRIPSELLRKGRFNEIFLLIYPMLRSAVVCGRFI